jgi:hypothetical protein
MPHTSCRLAFIRFPDKEKPAKDGTIISHNPIPQFGQPNQWRPDKRTHQPAGITDLCQNKHCGSPGFDDAPISHDNVDGLLTRRVELRRHRRRGTLLVSHRVKFLMNILAPDPGDSATSEASITVPQKPVLVGLNGHNTLPYTKRTDNLCALSINNFRFYPKCAVVTNYSTI